MPMWAMVGGLLFVYLAFVLGITVHDVISSLPALLSGLTHIKG